MNENKFEEVTVTAIGSLQFNRITLGKVFQILGSFKFEQFSFTTREAEVDYYYQKYYTGVASQVSELLRILEC